MNALSRRTFLQLLAVGAGVVLVRADTAAAAPVPSGPRPLLPGIHRDASRSQPHAPFAVRLSRTGSLPPY